MAARKFSTTMSGWSTPNTRSSRCSKIASPHPKDRKWRLKIIIRVANLVTSSLCGKNKNTFSRRSELRKRVRARKQLRSRRSRGRSSWKLCASRRRLSASGRAKGTYMAKLSDSRMRKPIASIKGSKNSRSVQIWSNSNSSNQPMFATHRGSRSHLSTNKTRHTNRYMFSQLVLKRSNTKTTLPMPTNSRTEGRTRGSSKCCVKASKMSNMKWQLTTKSSSESGTSTWIRWPLMRINKDSSSNNSSTAEMSIINKSQTKMPSQTSSGILPQLVAAVLTPIININISSSSRGISMACTTPLSTRWCSGSRRQRWLSLT